MKQTNEHVIKKDRFPASLFITLFLLFLLISGIHMGLIVLGNTFYWNSIVQVIIPIVYWFFVSLGLTLYVRNKVKITYEVPMKKLAQASKQVAQGDFSVYVPTIHTPDQYDYLDGMILNFNSMVEELGSIETLKTDFISTVSHEMKTPVAKIKSYSELLQINHLTKQEIKEYSFAIERATNNLTNLMNNILRLNKLENQVIVSNYDNYNLYNQLSECVLQFDTILDEKQIELSFQLEENLSVVLDQELMELVWNNLLSNAVKFTPERGSIAIWNVVEKDYLHIYISDTGCGIAQKNIPHIFDKFYQEDPSHTIKGNGLGLSLVKKILLLMEASISVTSEIGQGTTFKLTFLNRKERYRDDRT